MKKNLYYAAGDLLHLIFCDIYGVKILGEG